MTTALPFEAFLDVLRTKGYAVGLHEHAALANLLNHWDRTHTFEFGDAVAALIARSDEELRGIRRLFQQLYTPPPPPPPPPEPPVATSRLLFLRRRSWSMALIAGIIVFAAAVWTLSQRSPIPAPAPPLVPPFVTPDNVPAVSLPPPPAPELPPRPERLERRFVVGTLGASFLGLLAVFWQLKARDDRRAWLREAWSAVRATLPGPFHFQEVLRDRPAHLPRADVEDAATLLGRVFSTAAQWRELDVSRSLRATLRRGMLPHLIFKSRRVAETVLVLQDVCQEMGLWTGKVDAFLSDLRRQGVALERWYFDGDLLRVSERPHRLATPLDTVMRRRPYSPLLIIGSGSGLGATLAHADKGWLRALTARARRAWLTPVADLRLWPHDLEMLPFDVWPMTRSGLTQAARQLAGLDGDASVHIRTRLAADGRVTLEEIERLKRLASLVPHPTPELLEVLRHRFAPEISDAAVLHLLNQTEGPTAPVIRLSEDDLRRCLDAVRRENPELELAARRLILQILLDSQPTPGSAAHVRWQIAVRVQKVLLADLQRLEPEVDAEIQTLRALAEGPMWEEVREVLRLVPTTSRLKESVKDVVKDGRFSMPPAQDTRLLSVHRVPWSWPGPREYVPAAVAATLLVVSACGMRVLPTRIVDHIQDAYNLEYDPTPSTSTPQLVAQLRPGDRLMPRSVDLYQDKRIFRSGVTLTENAPVRIQLASEDTGKYYQVRSTLPAGNMAVSRAVWVTSGQLAFVSIDASPWADVTIRSNQSTTGTQQTPFTAALEPGAYQLHFENRSLTPPSTLDQPITVPSPGNAVHVTMPGFDAAQAVDALMQRGR